MIETALLLTVGAGLYLSHRYPWWRRALPYKHPRILMYHMIDDRPATGPAPNLAVSPGQFAKQVRWLRRAGWHFATVSELNTGVPRKSVAITFDDGYADNLHHALPILQANEAKATVYLIADRAQPLAAGGDAAGEPFAPLLRDDQVRTLLDSGVIELGAHTVHHVDLTALSTPAAEREIIDAKQHLEQTFGCAVTSFAYPLGRHDERLAGVVADAGYTTAVTTKSGVVDDWQPQRLRLPRIRISGSDDFWNFRIRLKIGRKR